MYSCGPPHMDVQEWDDQHELTYSSYVRTRDVTLKTCRRRWMIGRNGERRSVISAQAARHDDDDDGFVLYFSYCIFKYSIFLSPRLVAKLRQRNSVYPTFYSHWKENICFHSHPLSISSLWNLSSLVQDSNSGRRVSFLRW